MKHLRITLVVLASILAVAVGFRFVAGWLISGAFESASRAGDLKRLGDVLKASVGSTLARGDSHFQQQGTSNQFGVIESYKGSPQQLLHDEAYFDTWHSALSIATAVLQRGHRVDEWTSSADVTWIPNPNKQDSWGHMFCVRANEQRVIVVSPGPSAVSALDCKTITLSQHNLDRMPPGRLNQHPSGALVLFLQRSHPG